MKSVIAAIYAPRPVCLMCSRKMAFNLSSNLVSLNRLLVAFVLIFCAGSLGAQPLLTLKEAIAAALENNPDVKAAKAELDMANESNTYGNAGFLPELNLNTGRAFQQNDIQQRFANGLVVDRPGVGTNQFNAGISLSWTLYDGGQMFVVKKRQNAAVTAADLRWQNLIINLSDSVSSAFYQLVLAGMELRLLEEEEKLVAERLKMASEQLRLGLRSKSDLLLAQIDINQIQNRIRIQQKQTRIRKGNFNLLLGRDAETDFQVEENPGEVNAADFRQLKAKVMGQNMQIRYQKQNLEIARLNVKQLKTRALPQITLNSAFNFAQTRNQAGFALFNRSYGPGIGLTFSMPLFQGTSVARLVKIGNIDLEIRNLQLKSIENRILAQVWRLVQNTEIQLETIETENRTIALAMENAGIIRERFALGQSGSLELKNAEFQLTAAKNRLLQARFQARILEIQLLRYTGELKINEAEKK